MVSNNGAPRLLFVSCTVRLPAETPTGDAAKSSSAVNASTFITDPLHWYGTNRKFVAPAKYYPLSGSPLDKTFIMDPDALELRHDPRAVEPRPHPVAPQWRRIAVKYWERRSNSPRERQMSKAPLRLTEREHTTIVNALTLAAR